METNLIGEFCLNSRKLAPAKISSFKVIRIGPGVSINLLRNGVSNLAKINQNFEENLWKGPKNVNIFLSGSFVEFNYTKEGQICIIPENVPISRL